MLSPDVQARLLEASMRQKEYRPNDQVQSKLREKSLVMCVGPAAIGKSYLMNHLVEADSDFHRIPVFTTRDARDDDEPGMFRIFPHDDTHVTAILDDIAAGEVVQYAIHPTSGRIYGSTVDDYPGRFNVIAMLSGGVAQLEALPFKSTVLGLVTDPATWETWFNTRYPSASSEKRKRLDEAVVSLEWLLDSKQKNTVHWVENSVERSTQTTKAIIGIVKYNQQDSPIGRQYAKILLEKAKEMS